MPPLLKVENLTVAFPRRASLFHPGAPRAVAVDDVSFAIERNAVAGLIGERGCGKTSLAHAIAGLLRPSSGRILFEEKELKARPGRPFPRQVQLLFQDCRASLNPFATVETTLVDTIRAAETDLDPAKARDIAREHLERVGLPPQTAAHFPRDLPHGHCERAALARAISLGARFLIVDDSIAGLDLRLQKEFIELLLDLKEELRLTCLFACHDFGQLRMVAEEAIVMSRGKIVESAPVASIIEDPQHDFTKKLLASTVTLN